MKTYLAALSFLLSLNSSYSQWIVQPTPSDITMLSMEFIDSQSGAATGYNSFSGKALYTTNAGNSWLSASVPDSSWALVTMQFINSMTGYCAGAYGLFSDHKNVRADNNLSNIFSSANYFHDYDLRIGINNSSLGEYRGLFYKTTDTGRSWNTFGNLPAEVYYLLGLNFINEHTGFVTASYAYAKGVDCKILKTTNGGNSWFESPLPASINGLRNIFFTDDNNGYAVGYKNESSSSSGAIVKTTNSGTSWTLQVFPNFVFKDIYFTNSLTGFITGTPWPLSPNMFVIYKTTNAGANWILFPSTLKDVSLRSIKFVPGTGVGLASGSIFDSFHNEYVFTSKTTDYGESWNNHILNDSGLALCNFLYDQNNWYIGGFNYFGPSFILHSTNGGVGISTVNNSIPDNFELYQNYPNPFNPSTKIKFQIPKSASVNIIVYDALGKEIKTIINEKLQPGIYEIPFDGLGLTSGIYFYKIISGEFSEVRKMLLIK